MQKRLRLRRMLRKKSTKCEKILWKKLRNRKLCKYKFRRQVSIGPYVADFCSYKHRLIIELDGYIHIKYSSHRDKRRDAYLRKQGFDVVHIQNRQVYQNLSGVIESIVMRCENGTTIPSPSTGEGEGEGEGCKTLTKRHGKL